RPSRLPTPGCSPRSAARSSRPPSVGTPAHVFVADLTRPELAVEDRHHLERVLRLRPGEEVTAADRAGGWRRFRYRGAWLPDVHEVVDFATAVALAGPGGCLAHRGGEPPGLDRPAVLIGPEGGFTADELACGLPPVDLGPAILRSESAAMAAGVLLSAM